VLRGVSFNPFRCGSLRWPVCGRSQSAGLTLAGSDPYRWVLVCRSFRAATACVVRIFAAVFASRGRQPRCDGARPWASGPSNRTTAGGPRPTVSGCACVPAPVAPSCRPVAGRAAASSRR